MSEMYEKIKLSNIDIDSIIDKLSISCLDTNKFYTITYREKIYGYNNLCYINVENGRQCGYYFNRVYLIKHNLDGFPEEINKYGSTVIYYIRSKSYGRHKFTPTELRISESDYMFIKRNMEFRKLGI